MRYADLRVGQTAAIQKTITEADINSYAGIIQDFNPLHVDSEYAARSRFGGKIAHGMLTAGLISTVVGMRLPGTGAIYLSQTLRFTAPVRPGDTIEARAQVLELWPEKQRVRLGTVCVNQRGEIVIEGEALMLVDDLPATV